MFSLAALTSFNLLVLLSPPQAMADLLTLMMIPTEGRLKLLLAVAINMAICILYEGFGYLAVAGIVGRIMKWRKRNWRIRETGGKVYKAVEGGMR